MAALWEDEEIEILATLCKKGISLDKIMEVFPDRSEYSIRGKLRHLGLRIETKRNIDYDLYKQLISAEEV